MRLDDKTQLLSFQPICNCNQKDKIKFAQLNPLYHSGTFACNSFQILGLNQTDPMSVRPDRTVLPDRLVNTLAKNFFSSEHTFIYESTDYEPVERK